MADWVMLWQQRTRREQRLLIGMGLLLAVGIIWYALWQPWLSQGSPLATNARQRAGNPALDAAANAPAPAASPPDTGGRDRDEGGSLRRHHA